MDVTNATRKRQENMIGIGVYWSMEWMNDLELTEGSPG